MSLVTWAPLYFALDFLDDLAVNIISSVAGVHLVPGSRDGPVDAAQVGRTRTDVDDKGVLQACRGRKRRRKVPR